MSLPLPGVLLRAAQLSVEHDKPIYLDYYEPSIQKACCIGIRQDTTKSLVKSENEYTSSIEAIARCENCYIVSTENSIYIVSSEVPIRNIFPPKQTATS
jgi:hypothetical protein